MRAWFRKASLKVRLISSYLVILGIGGLVTSLVGSWIVSSTLMRQARRAVDHDFAAVQTVFDQRLETLKMAVQLGAAGSAAAELERVRRKAGMDFLSLTDRRGRVVARVPRTENTGDDAAALPLVRTALAGRVAAGTEILPAAWSNRETGRQPADALVLMAAAPVREGGVLYGGLVLNGNIAMVDSIWRLLSTSGRQEPPDRTSVSVFQRDARIASTLRTPSGERAAGTVPAEVREAVLGRGETWRGRAFVMRDWYISVYEPVRNHAGEPVGMLGVGLLESTYASIRNRVVLSFFAIATAGFILILAVTYYMIGTLTRPIEEMVAATESITAGRFDREVRADSPGELAQLAASFNAMLKSLRQMKGDLEEWGRTLEQKVRERTEELVAMQARVAQSERLASVGMLAAGVAHEVNNPLGGILALTTLTLEDMQPGDPDRENLEEVIKQTGRCRDIVRRLLEFSRQSKSHAAPADLNRILQDALSLVSGQASFFNIEVMRNLDPHLPTVMADELQMQQVFTNILVNAAQAMDEKGTITLTTRYNPATRTVEVAVADTGRGIPPEQIGRIFDPFFTTKESGQGTGLGLSIAYGIVTTHGGSITVDSEPGKGSTFTIRMPATAG